MSHKIKVQFGGAVGATVHDYSPDVRLYNKDGTPAIHGGMRFDSGGGSAGEFILIDDDNRIPAGDAPPDDLHLAGHNPIWWIEDSPGYDSWLSVGWIDVKDVGRFGHPYSVSRTWQASWADANKELDGITLLTAESRPAESGVTRLQWVLDTFYSGDPRPSTDLSTDTDFIPTTGAVTMPAKTYDAGTAAQDIIKECAATEGKVYGVIIHDASSASHKCFQYIDEEDHTTNLSTAKISDQLADWNPTDPTNPVFEPHWLQGAAATEDPGELISGVVSTWKGGTVTVTDATHADDYNYYVIPINDDVSENATQATNYATAYLHSRWNEHVTHQPSIMVSPSQHPLIRAGMSIQIKSAASMGGQYLGTYQTRRIAEVNWEPGGQWNGSPFLWAHLQLDRPLRILSRPGPLPTGPQPASDCSGAPEIADVYTGGSSTSRTGLTVPAATNQVLLAVACMDFSTNTASPAYDPDTVDTTNVPVDFTLVASVNGGSVDSPRLEIWALLNPAASNGAHGAVTLGGSVGTGNTWSLFRITGLPDGVTTATLLEVTETASVASPGTSISDAISSSASSLILSVLGYVANTVTATPGAGLTTEYDGSGFFGPGDPLDPHYVGSRAGGSVTNSWTLSGTTGTVNDVIMLDVAIKGCESDIPPASDDGTGAVGDNCTKYACADHKHPVQTAAVTPITDAGGYYTSTDVEGALQEAGASIAAGGAPTDVDYLVGTASGDLSAEIVVGTSPGGELGGSWASPTVDTTHSGSAHTDFIAKAIVDAKGDLIAGLGADTVARLPVGTNGQRLVADSTKTTGLAWADASAVTEADVRDAGRWELAVLTGSPPDPLYADGDYLYIWVSGA